MKSGFIKLLINPLDNYRPPSPPSTTLTPIEDSPYLMVVGGADSDGDTDRVEIVPLLPESKPMPACMKEMKDVAPYPFVVWRAAATSLTESPLVCGGWAGATSAPQGGSAPYRTATSTIP